MIKTVYITTLVNFCCHTLALSECEWFSIDYLNELKKKFFQEKQNLKKGIDKTREINEKRMKKNYLGKVSKRRRSRATNRPLSPENP